MKKKEIVINSCFGGFGLSEQAFELYLKKKGQKFYKEDGIFGSYYYSVPIEKYKSLQAKWFEEDGDYRRINAKHWFLADYNIKRDDPFLIEVVKELGDKANGGCAELKIVKIPNDIEWIVSDYDGRETVEEKHKSWD